MFNTIGERLVYCRGILGYTRKELIEQLKEISLPTLSRWELNYVNIPYKKLEILISFFQKKGIKVGVEWLRTGEGIPPINLNLQDFNDIKFDEITHSILLNLHKSIKNFQFKQINNNFYEPILSYGDYISGIVCEDYKLLDGKFCFIISKMETTAGILSLEDKSLKNIHNEKRYYNDLNSLIAGEILWLARRP